MKRVITLLLMAFLLSTMTSVAPASDSDALKLWYKQPAGRWTEALPVGNGSLGAMVFGSVAEERIQLNEETIWTEGGSYVDKDGSKIIPKVRKLLFAGEYEEAEKLIAENLMNERLPSGTNTYQTLGDLSLTFEGHEQYSDYRRELDLETALAKTRYNVGGVKYTREVFSSYPDKVLVVRLFADKKGSVSFKAALSRPGDGANIEVSGNEIVMNEHVGGGKGVRFEARVKVITESGSVGEDNGTIVVRNADNATILITASSDYRGGDPHELASSAMSAASSRKFEALRTRHISDYRSLFTRVSLDLGATNASYFATDERIDAMSLGCEDPSLIALYFQFGRYLLISSSRPGSLPANLQGIWTDSLIPPWNSDYHININIQMNYWPSEVTNLSECHLPFLEFIGRLREKGRITAKTTYGCKGFTAHHTTDVWHNTALFGMPVYGMWPMGPAWSCRHIWEHYLYTGDRDFLAEHYPVMKEAAEFCLDFLVKHPKTGKLVSGPSISPENTFLTKRGNRAVVNMGPAMDQEIIYDLFTNCIETTRILDTDSKFRKKLIDYRERLAPVTIGKDGRVMEWVEEFQEAEPGHRHMSHLYAMHPGSQFTWQKTPDYMQAVRKSIDYRLAHGGGHTGWSRAWIVNFFARLKDGNKAHENISALIAKSTLPNMFDTHPPFQIDGNFGGCAGIAEMLLQSHAGEVDLLPALPDAWDSGSITGLKARGGFEVDMTWEHGRLLKAVIRSELGNPLKIRNTFKYREMATEAGVSYTFNGDLDRI